MSVLSSVDNVFKKMVAFIYKKTFLTF